MQIRPTTTADLPCVMEIYAQARTFMAETGNPNQWGPTNWPPQELIEADIAQGTSYVCENDGRVAGVFFFAQGTNVEPTYAHIEDGTWLDDSPYGVVHRIASNRSTPGIGRFCMHWAIAQAKHIRIDTHTDNTPMRNMLESLGFSHRGTIFVYEDHFPRMAYEYVEA